MIVSDADDALTLAIHKVFGDRVEHRLCDWRLGRKLRDHLPDELLADTRHPIVTALPEAFRAPANWQRLQRAIEAEHTHGEHAPLTLATRWMDTYGQRAKAQIQTREAHGINSTGPVEQTLREIERRIVNRVGSFTNRARLAKLLDLITLDMTGKETAVTGPTACASSSTSLADARTSNDPTTTPRAPIPCSPDHTNVSIRIE